MRKVPLKRKMPIRRGNSQLKRSGKLKPVSDKRKGWNAKYAAALAAAKAKQVSLEGTTYCERCGTIGPVDGHHPNGRLNENILRFHLLCRLDHDWAHANKQAARAEGWFD